MSRLSTMTVIVLTLGSLVVTSPAVTFAGAPAEQLATRIDRLLAVLSDPSLRGAEQTGPRRQAVRRLTDDIVSWDEMGRRTLGTHWKTLGETEQRAFVGLFSELLCRAYLKNLDRYDGEKILLGDESVEGDRAVVHARVVGQDGQPGRPLDFAMVRDGERWRVWDVRIQGASMVGGYRAQFARLLQSEPYATVLQRLQARVDALEP
jgi:phospholipid transport system substrate-binding protein